MKKKDFYLTRKRSPKRCNDEHQKSRPKRRRLESSSNDDIDAEKSNFEQLPSNCLQDIWSFVNYEKVSQMRQVCKIFNETSKNFLDKGHRRLEKRLNGEIEIAEKMVYFPTNVRSSYDLHRFLKGLHAVINDVTICYKPHVDYFVAGKLLDEANDLLKDYNSSTVIPYFPEHIYDQQPHLLLGPIIAHCKRASQHFYLKILNKFIPQKTNLQRWKQIELEIKLQVEQNIVKISKSNLLRSRRQRIVCKKKMGKDFLNLILRLNETVVALTQRANAIDEEVERAINVEGILNKGRINLLLHLSTPSNMPYRATTAVGIPGLRRPNLATLPTFCLQNIVLNLSCDKMGQLRRVCKPFNDVCKQQLNREFDKVMDKFKFQIKCKEQREMKCALVISKINVMKDLCGFLQLCKDTYKLHLGSCYYFVPGKVLDDAKCIYNKHIGLHRFFRDDLGLLCKHKPHRILYNGMNLIYKAIAHFKFNIAAKYFPLTQEPIYISDFLITNDGMNFDKESQLNLEEIEKLIETANVQIKEQNDRNRKFLNIISGLKKKVSTLNKEICERIIALMS